MTAVASEPGAAGHGGALNLRLQRGTVMGLSEWGSGHPRDRLASLHHVVRQARTSASSVSCSSSHPHTSGHSVSPMTVYRRCNQVKLQRDQLLVITSRTAVICAAAHYASSHEAERGPASG